MKCALPVLAILIALSVSAADLLYVEHTNVSYAAGTADAYALERCKLDLYLPAGKKNFPTVVWFHGGGLESGDKGGSKKMGRSLAEEGIALVSVNYRLSPKVQYPVYIEDAAAACAWVLKHISEHGGNPAHVFVSGHSAGGYLALMLALDESRLLKFGAKPADFPGYIPVSGQTVTHFAIRKERGLTRQNIIVDDGAPLRYVRKDIQPMLLLTAERETEMAARVEENELLLANLKAAGCKNVAMQIIPGRDHSSVGAKIADPGDPARKALVEFVQRHAK